MKPVVLFETAHMTIGALGPFCLGRWRTVPDVAEFRAMQAAIARWAETAPPFVALNEPETSLHPDLLPALARMIARAAERTQIWVVTHSRPLAEALAETTGVVPREVIRQEGATWLEGLTRLGFSETE